MPKNGSNDVTVIHYELMIFVIKLLCKFADFNKSNHCCRVKTSTKKPKEIAVSQTLKTDNQGSCPLAKEHLQKIKQ